MSNNIIPFGRSRLRYRTSKSTGITNLMSSVSYTHNQLTVTYLLIHIGLTRHDRVPPQHTLGSYIPVIFTTIGRKDPVMIHEWDPVTRLHVSWFWGETECRYQSSKSSSLVVSSTRTSRRWSGGFKSRSEMVSDSAHSNR